jgi:hypothetical protein
MYIRLPIVGGSVTDAAHPIPTQSAAALAARAREGLNGRLTDARLKVGGHPRLLHTIPGVGIMLKRGAGLSLSRGSTHL